MSKKTDIRARLYLDNNGLRPALVASEGMIGGFANKATLLLAAGGVAAAAGFAKGLIDGMNQQQLASKFGEEAIEASARIYRNAWGDSLEEVASIRRDVEAGFGAAANLDALTESAFILAEKFDRDVGGTVQDVTELVESFGLEGEKAFDLWATALTGMTTEMQDELSAATREYGDYFQDLGLGPEYMLSVFKEFGEDGAIGIDKVGDALKELTIRGTDMSKASSVAFEAMGKDQQLYADLLLEGGDAASDALFGIIRGLQEIEDPSHQAAAAIALFGTPLEDLGAAGGSIPQFLDSLTGLDRGMWDTQVSVSELGAELSDNLSTKLEGLKRGALGALADFMEARVIPVIEDVADAVIEYWPTVQQIITDVTAEVNAVIERYWPTVQQIITDVVTTIAELIDEYWPTIKVIIEEVSEAVAEAIEEYWPQVEEIIVTVMETVRAAVERVIKIITYIWERWGEEISEYVDYYWGYVRAQIGAALDFIQAIFQTFKALFEGDWAAMWEGIKATLSAALELIKNALGLAWEQIKLAAKIAWDLLSNEVVSIIRAIPGKLLDLHVALYDAGKSLFLQAKNGMEQALREAAAKVILWVMDLPGKIVNLGIDLYNTGLDMFTTLKDGLIDALAGLPGAIADLVLGPLDEIYDKVTGVLGLGSGGSKSVVPVGGGTPRPSDDTSSLGANAALLAAAANNVVHLHSGGPVTQSMAQGLPGLERDEVLAVLRVGEYVNASGGRGNAGGSGAPFIGEMHIHENQSALTEIETAYTLYGLVA